MDVAIIFVLTYIASMLTFIGWMLYDIRHELRKK